MEPIKEEVLVKKIDGTLEDKGYNIISNFVANNKLGELLQVVTRLSDERRLKYKDYDEMAKDSIIASALELVTEDATQLDMEKNLTVWADPKCEYAEELDSFFRKLDLEGRIWGWTYRLVKYGDFFLGVNVEKGEGVVSVDDTKDPAKVYRLSVGGVLSAFYDVNDTEGEYGIISNINQKNNMFPPWNIVHFINNYNPAYEKLRLITKEEGEDGQVVSIKRTYTSAYGASYLANSRTPAKVLNLQRQTLALARVSNSPIIRAVYVNISGMPAKERREVTSNVLASFKSKMAIDKANNFFDSDFNPLSFNDVIVIPVTGEMGDIRVEEFGGRVDIKDIVDVEFTRNELFGSLRIPKAFLSLEESLPGFSGNSTLLRLDIRYARMVKKIQRSLINGLLRLCQIHLSFKYKKVINVDAIKLNMVSVSDAEEASRLDAIERKINMVSTALNMVTTLGEGINPIPLLTYIFKSLLGFDEAVVKKILEPTEMRLKQQLAGGNIPKEEGAGGGFSAGPSMGSPTPPSSPTGAEEAPEETGGEVSPEETETPEKAPAETPEKEEVPTSKYADAGLPPILASKVSSIAGLLKEGNSSSIVSILKEVEGYLEKMRDNIKFGRRDNADFDAPSYEKGKFLFENVSHVAIDEGDSANEGKTRKKGRKKKEKGLESEKNE